MKPGTGEKPSLGSKYKPLKGKPGSGTAKKASVNPPFKPTTRPARRGK